MNHYDEFFVALEEAIERAGSIYKLARYTGLPLNSISRWRKKERTPTLEGVSALIPFIDWPRRGKGTFIKNIGENAPTEKVEGEDLPTVPVIGIVGAGNPRDDVWEIEPDKFIQVLPKYHKSAMRALEVSGDSMEPTIKDGSLIGVMPIDGPLKEGAVYVVRVPSFGLVCKRVRANGLSGITLISDNPAYPPVDISAADCDNVLVGKVVWHLQEI